MSKPSKTIKRRVRASGSTCSLKRHARAEARNGNTQFREWLERKGCKV